MWRQVGFDEFRVSINVSPMQLQARTLAADTLAALERAGVAGAQLEIELTETSVFERPEEARAALETQRAAGVGISMEAGTQKATAFSGRHAAPMAGVWVPSVETRCVGIRRRIPWRGTL